MEEYIKNKIPNTNTIPSYGFNMNVYSSMLFIIPAIYSYVVLPSTLYFSFACMLCLITSVSNHYYCSKNKILNLIDIVCVNSIAAYYIFYTMYKIGFSFYANLMYFFAVAAFLFFIYLQKYPHLYEQYHCVIHLFAITGIMFCIKSLQTI